MQFDFQMKNGETIYRNSVTFLLFMAFHRLYPNSIIMEKFSIHKALYFEFSDLDAPLDEAFVERLAQEMQDIIAEDLLIEERTVTRAEAKELFSKKHFAKASAIFDYIRKDKITLAVCRDYFDVLKAKLASSTGYLTDFKLASYGKGLSLCTPMFENGELKIHTPVSLPKLTALRKESKFWANDLECAYVSDLNRLVENDNYAEIIRVSEALHEKNIAQIADIIKAKGEELKLIAIAGPSSSGKTSFAQRLLVQLRVNGLKPQTISLDDYYVDRHKTPIDENGDYDFESLYSIDLDLFNEHLLKLIEGEAVQVPLYNFKTGLREWHEHRQLKIHANQPIIIEGIHGLNEQLTEAIDRSLKYKIYVSSLTPLGIDYHNRIPTTQARLLRRIVRDYRTRPYSGEDTILKWASVRRGEEKNIFPYQEEADIMFNSSLLYELAVLKKYALPILYEIDEDSKAYPEARLLLDFLRCFLSVKDESEIPCNSILREFIGGSVFFKDDK